ncbi:MAG: hypothetical protein WCC97_12075 [Candidatus Acidiferrales bacterium]
MRIKFAIAVVVALLLGSGAKAQVSCSPHVDKKMCADAAMFMNPLVDHGTPYNGVGIPVEIITPDEYAKRLADMKEQESRELAFAGGMDKAFLHRDQFSPYYRHSLSNPWGSKVTFFRDKPASRMVSAILISSEEFEESTIEVNEKTHVVSSKSTGKYDPSSVFRTVSFIAGYLCGTMGTEYDGSIAGDAIPAASKP